MATQKEVLEAVERDGQYVAKLYRHWDRDTVTGIRNVSPAMKLEGKGVLMLKNREDRDLIRATTTTYTWVKA